MLKLTKKYSKYPAYKDSGVEWLGKIPNDWKLDILQHLFLKVKRTGFEQEQLLSVYRDRGVIIKSSRDDNHNKASEDLSTYQLVEVDDLAINKMKAWQGSIAIAKYRGIVSPAYYVCKPLSNINSKFIHYLLRSDIYIKQYERNSGGVRNDQWDLRYERFRKLEVAIPISKEQTKIANYLDEKTALIDQIIEKKQKLIQLLQEKRIAVINNAVTKGLDPNVEFVDSGVDWIEKIPKGWEVKKLKSGFNFEKGKEAGKFTQEFIGDEKNRGAYPVYSGQTENSGILGSINTHKYNYPEGVLFSTTVGAKAMTTKFLVGKFSLSQNCVLMIPNKKANSVYFNYLLEIGFKRMRDSIPSHMQPSLRVSDLNKFVVLFPPIDGQIKIASYLDKVMSVYNKTIQHIEQFIELLQEFKSSLISNVVTGKVKV